MSHSIVGNSGRRPAATSSKLRLSDDDARHLPSICDRSAPGTSDLVVDMFPLDPAGSVIGAAGHNAAMRTMADLGV